MGLVQITPTRRVYICGRRCHHGLYGLWRVLTGLLLIVHDRKDWPWKMID